MARTGLFADLRLAMRMAAWAGREGARPVDELADPAFEKLDPGSCCPASLTRRAARA